MRKAQTVFISRDLCRALSLGIFVEALDDLLEQLGLLVLLRTFFHDGRGAQVVAAVVIWNDAQVSSI